MYLRAVLQFLYVVSLKKNIQIQIQIQKIAAVEFLHWEWYFAQLLSMTSFIEI